MFGRTENITKDSSITYGASSEQGSGQYHDTPFSVTQEDTTLPQHAWSKVGTITNASKLEKHIIRNVNTDNGTTNTLYMCNFPNCAHLGRFNVKRRAIYHIRTVHLQERPYKCNW